MVLCEDGECSVCLLPYSRMDRIPGCSTAGTPSANRAWRPYPGSGAGSSPWPAPVPPGDLRKPRPQPAGGPVGQHQAVGADPTRHGCRDRRGGGDGQKGRAEVQRMEAKQPPASQAECISSRSAPSRLKLPAFFRRFSWTTQHRETIIPDSNVEMKSWRRLSMDDVV